MSRSLLREMGAGEILDAAFTLYRRHFIDMMKLGALFFGPVLVLTLVDDGLGYMAQIFVALGATIALMKRGAGHIIEEPASYGVCARTGLRKWFPVFAASFLITILTSIGLLLFVVPGVLLTAVWFAWMPVLVIENDWGFPSRSTALAKGAWAKILLVKLVSVIILVAPGLAIGMAEGMNATAPTDAFDAMTPSFTIIIATTLISLLTTPFSVFVDLMLYYERRVAVEGYDVELATGDLAQPEAAVSV